MGKLLKRLGKKLGLENREGSLSLTPTERDDTVVDGGLAK
jgi:hypothetical protein